MIQNRYLLISIYVFFLLILFPEGLTNQLMQVRVGINVIEHRSRMFVAMTLMYMTTYIDENGSKCSVLKGDPALVSNQSTVSKSNETAPPLVPHALLVYISSH